jgi:hypothetical protein
VKSLTLYSRTIPLRHSLVLLKLVISDPEALPISYHKLLEKNDFNFSKPLIGCNRIVIHHEVETGGNV